MSVLKFKVGDIVKVRNITNELDAEYYRVGYVGRIEKVYDVEGNYYPYHVEFNGYGNAKIHTVGLWYVQENDLEIVSEERGEEVIVKRIKIIDNRSDEEKSLTDLILG